MIWNYVARSRDEAAKEFAEWASLFSGELFVKLVVYADESGTHDKTGTQKGSREAILGGIVAPIEEWAVFCRDWQSVLNKYHAPYFHFREWTAASTIAKTKKTPTSDFKKNPYQNWDSETLDKFLIELARVSGSGNKLVVGGAVYTHLFHQAKLKGEVPASSDPYEHCLDQFFVSVVGVISTQRAPWKRQPISFFFDQNRTDREWMHAVADKFHFYKKQHLQFKELRFADKKEPLHLPLQAADMIAYRTRQITGKWVEMDASRPWPELDEPLFKSTFEFLDMNKSEVFRAYMRRELDYEGPMKGS